MTLPGKIFIRGALGALAAATMLGPAIAAPGELDSSFGSGGIATVTLSGSTTVAKIAEQSDGALVVAASTTTVLRLLANGSPDTSFGDQGAISFSDGGNTVRHPRPANPVGRQGAGPGFRYPADHQALLADPRRCCPASTATAPSIRVRKQWPGRPDAAQGNASDTDEPAALLLQPNGDILIAEQIGIRRANGVTPDQRRIARHEFWQRRCREFPTPRE